MIIKEEYSKLAEEPLVTQGSFEGHSFPTLENVDIKD